MTVPVLDAVLFDFDGTLAPNLDLPDMRRQVVALTAAAGVPEAAYADRFIVEVIDAGFDWLSQNKPANAEDYFGQAHRLITEFELAAARATDPFPGIREKLGELRAAGRRLGVVTRNCRAAVLDVFPDLLEHVHALHARGDGPYLKPDPRHLQAALAELGAPAERTAMVGDGAMDMRVGRALDMFCVGVLSGSNSAQALSEAGAHRVIDHAVDLIL